MCIKSCVPFGLIHTNLDGALNLKKSLPNSKGINELKMNNNLVPCSSFLLSCGLACLLGTWQAQADPVNFNHAPGDFVGLSAGATASFPSWTTDDRIVLSPYFYWYDIWSMSHLLNPDDSDALTTHPISFTGFSYKSIQWHKTQLLDMEAAGIDVVLPVYWGDPSQLDKVGVSHWSYAGIPPLVAAREALLEAGHSPPHIGMFYDTTTLERNAWHEHVDLTTLRGQAWYYESIRDYFSLIPPHHWALIDHKPVVFTWSAGWAKQYDQAHVDVAKRRFSEDFGGKPFYLVKEVSWNIEADDVYAWGGAFALRPLSVASLGPGYDHSNVPDREPFVIDREDGALFMRSWERLLRTGINRVMIETWNEYHEGTDISHSREYGRTYIELNRHYADLFKSRFVPPVVPGPFTDASSIATDFTSSQDPVEIAWIDWSDGKSDRIEMDGEICRRFLSESGAVSYLYFRVHDSFRWVGVQSLKLRVVAEAGGDAGFDVQFDGSDTSAPNLGAYSLALPIRKQPISSTVSTYEYDLRDARFLNSQNGGADFRLRKLRGDICIRSVELIKASLPDVEVLNPPSLSISFAELNQLSLRVHGLSGKRYVVEQSSDMDHWEPKSSVFIPSDQTSNDLEISPKQNLQYYRLRKVF